MKYNLCSHSSHPNHHPFLEAESNPPHGHQVTVVGELSQPWPQQHLLWGLVHTPLLGPKPSLGLWPPLLSLHWDSAGLPHEVFETWSSPAPQSFCCSLHSPLSYLQFSWRSASWTELSSECYMGIKIRQGVLSMVISVILHSHGCQQLHSCKQVLPVTTWFGEW